MGEGSGVLLLEELEAAKRAVPKIYAEVVGYGANCDAYHFTAPGTGRCRRCGLYAAGAGRRRGNV